LINYSSARFTWNCHDDLRAVSGALNCHLGFGNTEAIYTLANDCNGLIQLILRQRFTGCHGWRQNDLGTTAKVKS
jgi:hypothetical protein